MGTIKRMVVIAMQHATDRQDEANHLSEIIENISESPGVYLMKDDRAEIIYVGKAINPQGVMGQIQGGVGMGLGFALMEKFQPGKTLSMSEYTVLAARSGCGTMSSHEHRREGKDNT